MNNHSATLLKDGKVLIIGGKTGIPNVRYIKEAYLYNPKTMKFEITGDMSSGRTKQTAILLDSGEVWVLGGGREDKNYNLTELYIPNKHEFRDYINITVGFALLAAIGTAGYNIADDQALTYLRANAHINLNNFELTTLYFFIEAMSSFLCLLVVILMTRRNRQDLLYKIRHKKKNTILLGVTIYTTYTLVLISMAYVNNVSYVVAFRQLSIPLGAIAGVLILKESCYRTKVIGICVLLIGLLLVSTG